MYPKDPYWATSFTIYINGLPFMLIANCMHVVNVDLSVVIGNQAGHRTGVKVQKLGIILNNSFTWNDNVVAVSGKVFGMLRTLYKTHIHTPLHI